MRVWLSELEGSDLAATTRQLYRAAARRYLLRTLRSLLIGELTVPAIETLAASRSRYGPQPARAARRALLSLCRCAVCHGALRVNPVRDTRPIACPQTRPGAHRWGGGRSAGWLRADPTAVRLDLPDFVEFMLGTGVRVGEACAIRQAVLDLKAGTAHINATVYESTRPDWRSSHAPRPPDPNGSCASHDTWCGYSSGTR